MTTIAITGASGKLGRATLQFLLDRKVSPATLVPVVRDPAKLADLSSQGCQVRQGEYTDVASLEAAFRGVDKLLFISTSALGEERMLHHGNVVAAAVRARVGQIIYTSVVGPSLTAKFAASPGHFNTEKLIRDSGIPYTFFRNNLYMDLVPVLYGSAAETGVLSHFAGQGRIGFIARQDIAEALANVLTGGDHANRIYPITVPGPAYSYPEIAAAIGKAAGKSVRYQNVSVEEFRRNLEAAGLPPPVVGMSVALGEATLAGEFDHSSPDLETLLRRPPVTLDQFLAKR
jgi:NAD(P)H dehydrogenase (quinone)